MTEAETIARDHALAARGGPLAIWTDTLRSEFDRRLWDACFASPLVIGAFDHRPRFRRKRPLNLSITHK